VGGTSVRSAGGISALIAISLRMMLSIVQDVRVGGSSGMLRRVI
jgi:hypothetical protein